jgi:hypothetical protein
MEHMRLGTVGGRVQITTATEIDKIAEARERRVRIEKEKPHLS